MTKHKDVKEISLRSDVFSSLRKTALPRYRDGTVPEQIERGTFVLLNMDAPQHTRLRKIISRAFTPRAIERLRDDLNERARRIVQAARGEGLQMAADRTWRSPSSPTNGSCSKKRPETTADEIVR